MTRAKQAKVGVGLGAVGVKAEEPFQQGIPSCSTEKSDVITTHCGMQDNRSTCGQVWG